MIAGDYSSNTVSWMCWIFRYGACLGSDLSFILLKKSGVLKRTLPCERNGALFKVHHVNDFWWCHLFSKNLCFRSKTSSARSLHFRAVWHFA